MAFVGPPDEETRRRARRMLSLGIDPKMCRSRIRECETMAEVFAWVAVYNELDGQLPPRYDDLGAALTAQSEQVREGE